MSVSRADIAPPRQNSSHLNQKPEGESRGIIRHWSLRRAVFKKSACSDIMRFHNLCNPTSKETNLQLKRPDIYIKKYHGLNNYFAAVLTDVRYRLYEYVVVKHHE